MTVICTRAGSTSVLGVMAVMASITVPRPIRLTPSTVKVTRVLPAESESQTPEKDLMVLVNIKSVEPEPSAWVWPPKEGPPPKPSLGGVKPWGGSMR